MDLAVDVRFADAPRDQLSDLRTEVENQDFVVHGSGRGKEQGNNKSSARGAASNMYRGDRAAAKRGGLTGRKTAPITVATAVAPRRR
ncbi:hypothetical protein, partial [Burkholderia pseudomallei]|nr:hypothetical protein [Burkholderia pseudomallei]